MNDTEKQTANICYLSLHKRWRVFDEITEQWTDLKAERNNHHIKLQSSVPKILRSKAEMGSKNS